MKQIKTIVMAFVVIGTGLATSCKKYDEGGTHWRTKAKITDKTWKFDYASDTDTSFAIMDSWKTMQFEKNGDWVVNGNKWGTHNFYKDGEHKDQNSLWVYVDSSTIYWDSVATIVNNSNSGTEEKQYNPILKYRIDINQLKSKKLGLSSKNTINNTTHNIFYYAD